MPRPWRWTGFALALTLAGCASITGSKQISPGRFQVEHAYGGRTSYQEAVDKLAARAASLCTNGEYYKVNDYETTAGGPRRIIWEISCKEVPATQRRIELPQGSEGL